VRSSHWQKNIHVIAYAAAEKSRRGRFGIIKSWFTFSNPHHPFDYAVNSTLFCIAFFIGATLVAAAWLPAKGWENRTCVQPPLGCKQKFRSQREKERHVHRDAMRRATFFHAARASAAARRQPLRVRASSYLLNPFRHQ
jgi:hypothetical protein